MFLFTTPPASTRDTGPGRDAAARGAVSGTGRAGASGVVEAIRDGAQTSGAGFDYLLATAQRESGLDPSAKAGTSSATGLFQFIEQTWLGTLKNAGPRLGLSTFADAISVRADGTYTVEDAATRQSILDLRRDPKIAATMAGALTERNRETLSGTLGREPTGGDLYAAHVLGARGAAALIATAQASPARAAALDMPEAAAANRGLFYDKSGRPRGAAELYALLATARTPALPAGIDPVTTGSLPDGASAYAAVEGGGLRAMFQSDPRRGGGTAGLAPLWQNRASPEPIRSAPTYFPRSEEVVREIASADPDAALAVSSYRAAAGPVTPPTAQALVGAPLPPRRPAEFGVPQGARPGAPLDLSLFTTRSGP